MERGAARLEERLPTMLVQKIADLRGCVAEWGELTGASGVPRLERMYCLTLGAMVTTSPSSWRARSHVLARAATARTDLRCSPRPDDAARALESGSELRRLPAGGQRIKGRPAHALLLAFRPSADRKAGCPFFMRVSNQQSTGCGWPAVKVSGGAVPSRVLPFSEFRPLTSWADVGVLPLAPSPPDLAASANSRPKSHNEAVASLNVELVRKPG